MILSDHRQFEAAISELRKRGVTSMPYWPGDGARVLALQGEIKCGCCVEMVEYADQNPDTHAVEFENDWPHIHATLNVGKVKHGTAYAGPVVDTDIEAAQMRRR